jgi:hypothetical protein
MFLIKPKSLELDEDISRQSNEWVVTYQVSYESWNRSA